jgi:Tol biopolymer transport system component
MNRFALAILLTIFAAVAPATGQDSKIGDFDRSADIGVTHKKGAAAYDARTGEYSLTASGENMWFKRDDGRFAWKRIKGDFIITVRALFVGKGTDPHRKLGIMARSSLAAGSTQVSAVVHGDGLTSLQYREKNGTDTLEKKMEVTGADVLRLERKGDRYTMSAARFGEPFSIVESGKLALGESVYAGIFLCAHNNDVLEKAIFTDVRITIPAPDGFVPYRDYLGSRLEILDVNLGLRKVVHTTNDSMQAPNWTPDGKYLIYNRNGRLYRFEISSGKVEQIDTGFATANNNDHVLSFDGKMLGISHHSAEDDGNSMVYTLPVAGGTPKKITSKGPSYFHGWSPDGKWLVYTGGREGNYDIYKISSEGGEEIRLTDAEGLDDGSEYSPDGKYIYFCSTRTGLMQIWRMKPDGSGQEQITNDDYNNWFPHISPDGKWIVMISYVKGDVEPTDHPFYKRVYLRLMPLSGGKPKVIAYVYGGQGTINVPSWSPDGRRLAFVSNSVLED